MSHFDVDSAVLYMLTVRALSLLLAGGLAVVAWRGASLMDQRLPYDRKVRIRIVLLRVSSAAILLSALLTTLGTVSYFVYLVGPTVLKMTSFVFNWQFVRFGYWGLYVSASLICIILVLGDWAKPTFRSFAAWWWVEARLRVLWRRLRGRKP